MIILCVLRHHVVCWWRIADFIYCTVTNLPPVITFPKNAYSFDPGSPVTITCLIDSPNSAIEEVWWLKNGALLPTDGRIIVNTGPGSRSSDLEISSADVSDEGSYTCSAKNSAGVGSSDTMLTLSNPFGGPEVDVFSSISGDRVGKWLIDIDAKKSIFDEIFNCCLHATKL